MVAEQGWGFFYRRKFTIIGVAAGILIAIGVVAG